MNRIEYADIILHQIYTKKEEIQQQYTTSKSKIGYFWIDDLLPEDVALEINRVFPREKDMVLKKSLKEDKYIAVQMNQYHPILEEIIYAFQDERIVDLIADVCGIKQTIPDSSLYAGGLSMMGNNQFLQPHLDNSHDAKRELWRVLNLLYYVTPDWKQEYGGNLEIWPDGLKNEQITIFSKFNRLAVMATHDESLHSVSPVKYNGFRKCISNYYFSKEPLRKTDSFHVTSFRGRPEQKVLDRVLQVDNALRMGVRKVFKKGIVENPHVYKADKRID
ncbi:2OG-Fe(II) oxygenase [Empedobacter brevis]|uniref:2OG-Fe(II) oxygenase n=1 Tax=Empedobacter brevis TaxID=247 RepID=UPI002FE07188